MVGVIIVEEGVVPEMLVVGQAIATCTALESNLRFPQFIDIIFSRDHSGGQIYITGTTSPLLPEELKAS